MPIGLYGLVVMEGFSSRHSRRCINKPMISSSPLLNPFVGIYILIPVHGHKIFFFFISSTFSVFVLLLHGLEFLVLLIVSGNEQVLKRLLSDEVVSKARITSEVSFLMQFNLILFMRLL